MRLNLVKNLEGNKSQAKCLAPGKDIYCQIFMIQPNKLLFLFGILIVNKILRYGTKKEEIAHLSTAFLITTKERENMEVKTHAIRNTLKKPQPIFLIICQVKMRVRCTLFWFCLEM